MKRELTKILSALALLIGLVVLVWWHRSGEEKATALKEKEEQLLPVDLEKIERLTIATKHGMITLARPAEDRLAKLAEEFEAVSDWRIVEPVAALPDPGMVGTLLDDLKKLKSLKVISEQGANAADYHLDPALVTVGGFEKGRKEPAFTLRLGDLNTAASGVYARTSAAPKIVLAEMSIEYLKMRKPGEWRSKEIIGFKGPARVKKVTVETTRAGKKSRVTAERDAAGRWALTEPQKGRADATGIDTFFNELSSLRADSVPSEDAAKDAAKFGLERPEVVVKLVSEGPGGDVVRELIAGPETVKDQVKLFYLRRSDLPQIFSIANYMKEKLTKSFASWVAKDPFDLEGASVTGVEIERAGAKTELWKKDGKWHAAKPAGMDVDEAKVSELLSQLIALRGREWIGTKGTLGSGKADLRVVLTAGEEKRDVTFFVDGKKDPQAKALPAGMWYGFMRGEYDRVVAKASNLAVTAAVTPAASPAKE